MTFYKKYVPFESTRNKSLSIEISNTSQIIPSYFQVAKRTLQKKTLYIYFQFLFDKIDIYKIYK